MFIHLKEGAARRRWIVTAAILSLIFVVLNGGRHILSTAHAQVTHEVWLAARVSELRLRAGGWPGEVRPVDISPTSVPVVIETVLSGN